MNWQRIRNIVRPGQKCCTGQPGNPFGKGANGKVPALDIIERAFFLSGQQIVFSSKTPFVARSLLEKLSRQVLVMEKLAAVSDENLGNITSVVEGKRATCRPTLDPEHADLRPVTGKPGSCLLSRARGT